MGVGSGVGVGVEVGLGSGEGVDTVLVWVAAGWSVGMSPSVSPVREQATVTAEINNRAQNPMS